VVSESPLQKLARDAASACYNFIEPFVSKVQKVLDPTVNNICTEFWKMIRVVRGWKQCSIQNQTSGRGQCDTLIPTYCDLSDRHCQNYGLATEGFHMPGSHFYREGDLHMYKHHFLLESVVDKPSEALKK
jgi:hypothetical protein